MSQTLLQLVNHRFLNIIYYDHLYVIISIPGQRRVFSACILSYNSSVGRTVYVLVKALQEKINKCKTCHFNGNFK